MTKGVEKGDWGWRAEFCGLAIGIKNFDTLYETQQTTQQQQQRQTKTTQRALDIFGLRRWQTAKLPRPPLAQDRTTKLAEVGVPFLHSPLTKSTFIMLFLAEPQLNSICANECAHRIRARQRRSPSKNTNNNKKPIFHFELHLWHLKKYPQKNKQAKSFQLLAAA